MRIIKTESPDKAGELGHKLASCGAYGPASVVPLDSKLDKDGQILLNYE